MVIGGAETYRLVLPFADRIERTEVAREPSGDTVIAAPDPAEWREIAREDHPADEAGRHAYSFVTFARRTDRAKRRCVARFPPSSSCCLRLTPPSSCPHSACSSEGHTR